MAKVFYIGYICFFNSAFMTLTGMEAGRVGGPRAGLVFSYILLRR